MKTIVKFNFSNANEMILDIFKRFQKEVLGITNHKYVIEKYSNFFVDKFPLKEEYDKLSKGDFVHFNSMKILTKGINNGLRGLFEGEKQSKLLVILDNIQFKISDIVYYYNFELEEQEYNKTYHLDIYVRGEFYNFIKEEVGEIYKFIMDE